MALFDRIVATGSLSAAGRALGLSPGAVSQRLSALETRYGTALLTRSSRAIALTDEGRIFLETARNMLAETQALNNAIASKAGALAGRLRVAAPSDLARKHVEPLVLEFTAAHSEVCVELLIGDYLEDLVSRGIDVAFRYGNLKDSALIARQLAPNRRVVVGAPAYLEARGQPEHPDDLEAHDCLVHVRDDERIDRWPFDVDAQTVSFTVHGKLAANDGEVLRRWALAGKGLAYKALLDVRDDLANGRLIEVLRPFTADPVGAQMLFPASRKNTPRVRTFVEMAARCFASGLERPHSS